MKELWTEKYRPATLDGYVFRDETQRAQIEKWITEQSIPNLLFSGNAGVGKTTLAKIIVNHLKIEDTDLLIANGSKEGRKINWVDTLIGFCQTMPFGDYKIVIIDEADYLNPNSVQPALRNLMEQYSYNIRFILTCNYPNRIIPALHSRCQQIHVERTDLTEFTARMATILVNENVEFDLDTLDNYVTATYPDLRKCINNLQTNSINGKLGYEEEKNTEKDYKIEVVDLFKKKKISEARKLICKQITQDEIVDFFKWMYNNIELFGDEAQQEKAILIIKQGLVDHTLVVDPEINLSATLVRLSHIN